jgi:two-component system LytT family response regulator
MNQSPLRAVIVDDENSGIEVLEYTLRRHCKDVEIIRSFTSSLEAAEAIPLLQPDVLFVDVEMPQMNGFELVEKLNKLKIQIIFTTAYNEFALKAFRVSALDYLLKPIDPHRLEQAIKKLEEDNHESNEAEIQNRVFNEEDQVFVKDGNRYWFIKLSTVRLFESIGNYVRIYFENNKPLILRSLNALEERLDPNVFFRANRKHIINLRMIESIEPYFSGGILVKLKGGEKVEVSRRQAVRFKDQLSL